jgi:hypothetical protein
MGSSSASATSGHSPEDLFTPKPAPTWTPKQAAQNEALIKQNAKDTADPTKCPMNHPYQACCRTLTNIADAIFKPIGEIIPQLKGANLASPMSFECMSFPSFVFSVLLFGSVWGGAKCSVIAGKPMTPGDPPEKCAHQASCCGSDPKEVCSLSLFLCLLLLGR